MKSNVLSQEKKTVLAMIRLYCRGKGHARPKCGYCGSCEELLQYARERIDACVFSEKKPVCAHCPVHCYRPGMRQRIAEVMRYAGPRMPLRHPVLAVRHLLMKYKRRGGPLSFPISQKTVCAGRSG